MTPLSPLLDKIDAFEPMSWTGRVTEIVGLLVESAGPAAAVGDFCEVRTNSGRAIRMQVIGFRDGRVLSMKSQQPGIPGT